MEQQKAENNGLIQLDGDECMLLREDVKIWTIRHTKAESLSDSENAVLKSIPHYGDLVLETVFLLLFVVIGLGPDFHFRAVHSSFHAQSSRQSSGINPLIIDSIHFIKVFQIC